MRGMSDGWQSLRFSLPEPMTMNYALIDAATSPAIVHAIRSHAGRAHARALFERQPEAANVHAGPWLLRLDGEPGLQGLIQSQEGCAGAVARLRAEVEMEELFLHLEAQLDLRLANGSLALLRFWDGRALNRLWRVLTPLQQRRFMGPVTYWSYRLEERNIELHRPIMEGS